jgi:hypothetical protein
VDFGAVALKNCLGLFVLKYQNNSVNSCQVLKYVSLTTLIVECSVSMMGNMVWLVPTDSELNNVATGMIKRVCWHHILLHCKVIKAVIMQHNVSYLGLS